MGKIDSKSSLRKNKSREVKKHTQIANGNCEFPANCYFFKRNFSVKKFAGRIPGTSVFLPTFFFHINPLLSELLPN